MKTENANRTAGRLPTLSERNPTPSILRAKLASSKRERQRQRRRQRQRQSNTDGEWRVRAHRTRHVYDVDLRKRFDGPVQLQCETHDLRVGTKLLCDSREARHVGVRLRKRVSDESARK